MSWVSFFFQQSLFVRLRLFRSHTQMVFPVSVECRGNLWMGGLIRDFRYGAVLQGQTFQAMMYEHLVLGRAF